MLLERSPPWLGAAIVAGVLLLAGSPLWEQSWAELRPGLWTQPWRLLTGHWVHHTWPHLFLNAIALAGWLFIWTEGTRQRLGKIAGIGLLTGIGVCWLSEAAYVVGLSGLLHGLFAASALAGLREQSMRLVSVVVLVLLVAKVVYENLFGPLQSTQALAGLPVETVAHLVGVAAGLLYALPQLVAWALRPGRSE